MAMLQSNEIKKGKIILMNEEPTLVLSHEFSKTGRAGAVNRTKVKGLKSGVIKQVTFAGNEKAEEVEVINKNIQFLYADDDFAYFMDPSSFEQMYIEIDNIPSRNYFLKEGELYQGAFYENEVISVLLPKKMTLEVVEAPEAVKGDSANNPTKEVVVSTGYKVQTPLFIKVGDKIKINTETGQYDSKDNS